LSVRENQFSGGLKSESLCVLGGEDEGKVHEGGCGKKKISASGTTTFWGKRRGLNCPAKDTIKTLRWEKKKGEKARFFDGSTVSHGVKKNTIPGERKRPSPFICGGGFLGGFEVQMQRREKVGKKVLNNVEKKQTNPMQVQRQGLFSVWKEKSWNNNTLENRKGE